MSETLDFENWLIDRSEEKPNVQFDNRYADLITKVADCSPAAKIGLSAGDYLVSVNGQQAIKINLLEYLIEGSDEVEYKFYSTARQVYINVTASRLPLGFIHEPGSLHIPAEGEH